MVLTFSEYQDQAGKTAIYPGKGTIIGLSYVALGLGEVGELQGKVKKIIRDDNGLITEDKRAAIAAELGDLLWYVAATASELGYDLTEIAQANLHKLASRMERGVIGGSGDER